MSFLVVKLVAAGLVLVFGWIVVKLIDAKAEIKWLHALIGQNHRSCEYVEITGQTKYSGVHITGADWKNKAVWITAPSLLDNQRADALAVQVLGSDARYSPRFSRGIKRCYFEPKQEQQGR